MNIVLGYIKRQKNLYLFISIILIIGLFLGIFLGFKNYYSLQNDIILFSNNITSFSFSYLIIHFSIITFLLISSFFILGIVLFIITFFIEGLIIGYLLGSFLAIFNVSGLIFASILIIFWHCLFLLTLYLIFPKCIELAKNKINKLIYKSDNELQMFNSIKNSFIFIFIFCISDIFLYVFSGQILSIFHFLIM